MFLPFIFSLVFAIAISGMVFVRVWNIRRGKVVAGEEYEISEIFSVVDWEKTLDKASSFVLSKLQKVSVVASRVLVNFYHIAKKFIDERVEHFSMSIPSTNNGDSERGTASFFLKDISAHKDSFRNGEADKIV